MKKSKKKKEIYNPYLLSTIQPQGGIKFEEDTVKKGDGYEACIHIYNYPTQVAEYWLDDLLSIDNVITTITVGTEKKDKALEQLDKSMIEQQVRFNEANNPLSAINAQTTYQSLSEMTQQITRMGELMKMIHIRYYIAGRTLEELEIKISDLLKQLEGLGYNGAVFLNEQEYEFKALYQSYSDQLKAENKRRGKGLPSKSLGAGYPFNFTSLNDCTGLYLGMSSTGGHVIFDIFHKDKRRRYYNAVVIGTMGAGKSTVLKKLLEHNKIVGNRSRIIDVVGDFRTLVEKLNGKIISMDGSMGIQNPLQIMTTVTQGESLIVDNNGSFVTHIAKLSTMYKFINPEYITGEVKEFEDILYDFYEDYGIEIEKCTEYDTNQYPIFSDLLGHTLKILFEDVDKGIIRENITQYRHQRLENIILTLKSFTKQYGRLFNGHSSIENVSNEQTVSYELGNLSQYDKGVFNAQVFNVLTMLWNDCVRQGIIEKEAYENGDKSFEEVIKFLLFLDESHRIINSNSENAVDLITQYARETRKFFGGIILASQSIRDYVPSGNDEKTGAIKEKIKTLFELTQYKFIMQQDNNALSSLREIFEGQLSESEIASIPELEEGQCILSINSVKNIKLNIEATVEELSLFKGGV